MSDKLWWVPDESEIWVLAKQEGDIQSNGCLRFSVLGSGKSITQNADACIKTIVSAAELQSTPDDLISLPEVNQASILSCIRTRFRAKCIYTSVGTVLMTVNPFERIAGLYGPEVIKKYFNPFAENGSLKPHVYLVPSRAFADMCRTGSHQSILISGESGAGKTEATKGCLSFLTAAAEEFSPTSSSSSMNKADIAGRIIAASPVLEAFGNAKTVKNPNSSRFGKWMELKFNKFNGLEGSSITSYLLEKSRVTRRDPKERNYHIFYQMLRGMNLSSVPDWSLTKDTSKYRYLERPNLGEAPDLNDSEGFKETREAFVEMGFSEEEISSILRLVAAVLHLGNIDFIDQNGGESSVVNTTNHASAAAANLLSVRHESLCHTLTHRSMVSGTRRSVIVIQLKPEAAIDTRDSLARAVYDKLFKFIITAINNKAAAKAAMDDEGRNIGLLDIFGFEIFPVNSLEQLCINYCNEMLQNHFNFVIFTAEKALYIAEGIHCDTIEFKDNIPIIQDIEKLFKALDEEAKLPKGSSKSWYEKLKKAGASNKAAMVSYPTRKDVFVVQHYAGNVEYYPTEFLEKNTETLNNDLVECMMASADTTLQYLFNPANDDDADASATAAAGAGSSSGPTKKAQRSIAWKFQSQLSSLMTMLRKTSSHFIRCIKSNDECKPMIFDAKNVTRQLLYSGVFEVVKIQQSGLPCRATHREFIERYKSLAPFEIRYKFRSPQELIDIFRSEPLCLELNDLQNGASMVFFKGMEQRLLEGCLATWWRVNCIKIQSFRRCHYLRRVYAKMIVFVRNLHSFANQFQTSKARSCLAEIKKCVEFYEKAAKHTNLKRMYQQRSELVELTQLRENLITEAEELASRNTEEALKVIGKIMPNAVKLEISQLAIIQKCAEIDKDYQITLQFIAKAGNEKALSLLSMNDIIQGIHSLQQFETILKAVPQTLERARKWKKEVEQEIECIFEPLLHHCELASFEYDDESGLLRRTYGKDTEQKCRTFFQTLFSQKERFKCNDTVVAYEECSIFLQFLDEALTPNNAKRAIEIISSRKFRFDVFINQFNNFQKWANFELQLNKLIETVQLDQITDSATGREPIVVTEKLVNLSEPFRQLSNPSKELSNLLIIIDDIINIRTLYNEAKWKELEEFTMSVEERIDEGLYSSYPETIVKEIDNSIWHTSYQNALSDLLFVITDPAISLLPMNSSDWSPLLDNEQPSLLAIESSKSFSIIEKTPILEELLPIAKYVLELRQNLFSLQIKPIETLLKKLNEPQIIRVLNKHNLSEVISNEIIACKKLLVLITCEEELNDELRKNCVGKYSCNEAEAMGICVSRTAKQMGIYGNSQSLKGTIEKIENISSNIELLPESLIRLYKIGKKIAIGRVAVELDEKISDKTVSSDDKTKDDLYFAEQYQQTIQQIAIEETNNVYIEEIFQQELTNIHNECQRRYFQHQLFHILKSKCVIGTKGIDLHIDYIVLRECEQLLTKLLRSIELLQNQLPMNLIQLSKFVSGLLSVRKSLYKANFEELYNSLTALQQVLNDDGLAVVGIVEEIEAIRSEYISQMEVAEMKTALIDIHLMIDDNANKESKQAIIDRISDSLYLMNKASTNGNKEAKRLFEIGSLIRIILLKIFENQAFSIPESKVSEAVEAYRSIGLSTDAVSLIYKYVRLRHSLKIICDAMCVPNATSELIFETLDHIKAEMAIPTVLVPWIHCVEAYAQLLQALECRDWLIIVNRSRYLEELLVPLSALPSYDADNESRLLQLAKSRYQESYKVALAIKAVEAELQVTAAIENISVNEVMKRTLKDVDEHADSGISALRRQGVTDEAIVESNKFPLNQLWAMEVPAALLHQKGYSVLKMRAAGYTCHELLQGGYSVEALGKAGYESSSLRKAGATLQQLKQAGFSDAKILMAGYPVNELKDAGFDAGRLAKLGIAAKELVTAGFTGKELRLAGFTADQLRVAGMNRVSYLRASGYTLSELVIANFPIDELKIAGFDFDSLREVGVNDGLLLEAGFYEELTREALLDLYTYTNGKQWKIKMNWGTNRPLREWYGITVELGATDSGHQVEHVVGIDLHDNNLCGEIPERIVLLTRLKALNLSLNNLHGVVPIGLSRMKDLQSIDLTDNPLLREIEAKSGKKRNPRSPITKVSSATTSPLPKGVNPNAVNVLWFAKSPVSSGTTNRDEKLQDQLLHRQRDNEQFGRTEQSLLVEFFNMTQGNTWKLKRNWCTPSPLNQWFGLTVNRLDKIVKLTLPMNNLQGEIPTSIDCLINLKELDLRYNQLFGVIPSTIGNLKSLTHIHLHCNRLTGSIPESITDLSNLEVLDLRSNQLTGTLPISLSQLSNLSYLAVTSNFIKVPSKQSLKNKIPWCRVVIM